ncbi:hypothetical protein IW140_002736 [Coemansia sp. RSA 1813]|nr:hypothetical protein EV178_003616 [Coemansia sp. RSA 1646]KAJ2569848.1 hypothetical protein IW140_002736 [Coemansia sp. RSA 1813]
MDNTSRRSGGGGTGIEERRRQNRDAAARHRVRQQKRLEELTYREVLLKQRLGELQGEVEALKKQREGLRVPCQDPFTATILEMISSASALHDNLSQTSQESEQNIHELKRLARVIINRHKEPSKRRTANREPAYLE